MFKIGPCTAANFRSSGKLIFIASHSECFRGQFKLSSRRVAFDSHDLQITGAVTFSIGPAVNIGGNLQVQSLPVSAGSVRRGKAHLVDDGAIAWIGMQKIESRVALQKHEVRRAFLVTLLQIADRLLFTSEKCIGVREIRG